MNKWYRHSHWRNLVDMHINDKRPEFMGRFDPAVYADNMKSAGVDCSELYTGNCLGICFFPTEVGHMHEGLKGRDLVGETLKEIGDRGIGRVAYFNMWSRWAFDTYPEWRLLDINGQNSLEFNPAEPRFGICCPNNEEYRDYTRKQIEFICKNYDFDGMWIDMIGWFSRVCYCPTCRDKYRRATGKEMPERADWADPDWMRFQKLRQDWNTEFMHVVDDVARRVKPGVTMAYQSASWLSGWFYAPSESFLAMSDYLGADIYGTPLTSSVVCKSMSNMTAHKPLEYMTTRCVSLGHHTVNRSKDEMRLQVYGSLAHNTAFTFIDAINPDGTMDNRIYRMMGELKAELKPYFTWWNPDAVLQRDVTLYMNTESLFDPHSNDLNAGFPVADAMQTPAASLIAGHFAYDITTGKNLEEACRASRLILLNNTYVLSEDEVEILEEYVRKGGKLMVTGLSGMYSDEGKRQDFALARLMGVHYEAETSEDTTYMRPKEAYQNLMPDFNNKYPLSVLFPAVKVRCDADCEVLAELTLPWSTSKESVNFASALSDPPGIDTDYPALTLHPYGKGQVMYVAMPIQQEKCSAVRAVFRNLVSFMLEEQTLITTNAPDWMEIICYRGEGYTQLNVINAMDAYYTAEATDVRVVMACEQEPSEVICVGTGEKIGFTREKTGLQLNLGKVGNFAMYIIKE